MLWIFSSVCKILFDDEFNSQFSIIFVENISL